MSAGNRLKNALPLHLFVRRQQVLRLYRSMRRAAGNVVNVDIRLDLQTQIKQEFTKNAVVRDNMAARALIQEANRSLKMLKAMGERPNHNNERGSQHYDDIADNGELGAGWPWMRK